MRLIDADALIFTSPKDRIPTEGYIETSDIDRAKTIDPVKHGRLIDGIVSFHWTCSECGCHLRKDLGQVFERETDRYNYCPNCGAKMDGGEG